MTQRHLVGARILAQGLVGSARSGARARRGTESAATGGTPAATGGTPAPVEVARSFAAHQGQDLPGVIASLALRSGGAVEPVLAAFDRGEIVRGYPMRGTVFAVAADSLAWMTELCVAGPLRAAIARRGALDLDERRVERAREVLVAAAEPVSAPGVGRGLLRSEVMAVWEAAGIATGSGRGYHLLAELISFGDIAYGPWREQETAVVHAPTWLPAGSDLEGTFGGDRDAAAAELALRYLTSHGPAGERDLAWWSKLPLGTVRPAIAQVAERLESGFADRDGRLHARPEDARGGDGERLWFRPGLAEEYADAEKDTMKELLLPGFDELVLGYPDRLALIAEGHHPALAPGNNGVFKRAALRRGEIVGTWTRTGSAGKRRLVLEELGTISDPQRRRFQNLFARFPYTAA
ncbi:crosslink repair DNA glycosylase YcaQ family protein [Brachybacterium sp. J144]|uniref:DNA glycosylase AlkZ-like family protein n=1 Tax=Brachybacterium sp. J144 TaxID=3116487 RepID=UPI002E7A2DD6|nr:crosslink repair DNA glycosylase YcaQ family protein [Brachybacterium sp. J144]MEE1650151.1 crosslink repair DNA glycosylase YcaQ family protein [Brachybacterium sp. J144]